MPSHGKVPKTSGAKRKVKGTVPGICM